jgi:hypothetical protein
VFFVLGLITVAIYYLFIASRLRDDNKDNNELISQ